jgi:hypothetical protein
VLDRHAIYQVDGQRKRNRTATVATVSSGFDPGSPLL